MADSITEKTILKVLDWAYEQAIDGMPGVGSANDLAQEYMVREGTLAEQVNSLIRWQNAKAATSGFVSGLGGLITMPVAVPANISVVLFVQVRMIAAIAIMGGYDVNDDRVKSLVYACMAGNAAKGYLREVGIDVTRKLALSAIRSIPGKTLTAINQKVGFRLLTKFGEKGVVNLGKFVPLAGGYHRGNVRSRVHQRSWQSCQSCLLPRRNPSGSGCAQAGRWAGNRGAVKERWAVRGSSQRSMCVFQHAGGRFSVPVSA